MTRRAALGKSIALAAATGAPALLRAQTAIDVPLKIILAFSAGGTSDFLARLYAPSLSETLGRPVIVDYKPGVNGVVGLNSVAKSRADGNTIVLTDMMTITVTPWVMPSMPLKPFEELTPVAMAAYFPYLFVVNPALPIHNLADLKTYSLVHPGRFNLATGGTGTAQHLIGIEMANHLGVKWTYVPYKGATAGLVDLVGGTVDAAILSSPPLLPLLSTGKIRAIAASGTARWLNLPDTQTFIEQGLPGYQPGSYQGVLAPSQTPRPIIDSLAAAFTKAASQPDLKEKLADQGGQVRIYTPEAMLTLLKDESARWGGIVKANHIVLE
jgi:tripartite-type tricarboxylate transporter receptor subunit TctC